MTIAKDISKLGIIIEIKNLDPYNEKTLEESADIALEQIYKNKYIFWNNIQMKIF